MANNLLQVDCESAALDFSSKGAISGASFKTSIGRMKGNYSQLSLPDQKRMAACLTNIAEADLKPIMASVRHLSFLSRHVMTFQFHDTDSSS
jgi:hypothetical protein